VIYKGVFTDVFSLFRSPHFTIVMSSIDIFGYEAGVISAGLLQCELLMGREVNDDGHALLGQNFRLQLYVVGWVVHVNFQPPTVTIKFVN
jgi:hypothetical protein